MRLDHPLSRRQRARGAAIAVGVLMGTLVLAFFRAQVLGRSDWALQSDSNRLRPLVVPAPRGTVLDRNGQIVADNVPGYSVILLPAPTDTTRAVILRMAPHLGLSPTRVDYLLERVRLDPRQPLVVEANAGFAEVSALRRGGPNSPVSTWRGDLAAGIRRGRPWPTSWATSGR